MYNHSVRVKIDGQNQNVHECLDCSKNLSKHEYNMKFDRCSDCNRKHYKKNKAMGFADLNNMNDVDEILKYKLNYKRR